MHAPKGGAQRGAPCRLHLPAPPLKPVVQPPLPCTLVYHRPGTTGPRTGHSPPRSPAPPAPLTALHADCADVAVPPLIQGHADWPFEQRLDLGGTRGQE